MKLKKKIKVIKSNKSNNYKITTKINKRKLLIKENN